MARKTFPLFCQAMVLTAALLSAAPARAHPHVFIDGGVDFVFDGAGRLEAVQVTWLYDAFETLYMLSAMGLDLDAAGSLSEPDRQTLITTLSDWPDDFDGSAHLRVDDQPLGLEWPEALDAMIIDGRLQVSFTRRLPEPLVPQGRVITADFFESTFFFDFTLTKAPKLIGDTACRADVVPFDPDSQDAELLSVLAKLSREETSDIENVGAFFADRVVLTCG